MTFRSRPWRSVYAEVDVAAAYHLCEAKERYYALLDERQMAA